MPEEPLGPPDALDPDLLTGWKEIAAFVGKGVRTVQRWEKDYGFPVQRIGKKDGEIVLASKRAVLAWIEASAERLKSAGDRPGAPPQDGPAAPDGAETVAVSAKPRSLRWLWWAAAIVLVVATAGVWRLAHPGGSGGVPASIRIDDRRLTALDEDAKGLWTHTFDFALDRRRYPDVGPVPRGRPWALTDLDADGTMELLIGAASTEAPGSMALHVFNQDGRERFHWRPESRSVTFGDITYTGPWIPYQVFVTSDPGSFFAAFIHVNQYPTLLVEFDTQGHVLSEYWSNGYVETVLRGTWKGRETLFVGAANNDTRGGSLAVFDGRHLRGAAPAGKVKYRCMDCAEGVPDEFLVFPRRDGSLADGTATVQELKIEENGTLHVMVGEGARNPNLSFPAAVWYTLLPQLEVDQVEFSFGLQLEHPKWQKAGLVDHELGDQDLRDCLPVSRWTPSGWAELKERAGLRPNLPAQVRR